MQTRTMIDTSKLAIVYARQSTQAQVRENIFSTEGQLQLREKALADGFPDENVLVIDDDLGVSGRSIQGRVGMTKALKLMEQGLVAIVYAEDITRLSRDEDTIDHMIVARACRTSGTLLYMAGSHLDMRNAADRQMFKYQAVGASESWNQHITKLREGARRKAAQGKAVSNPPYGYRINREGAKNDPQRDRFIIHEPEAQVIRFLAAKLHECNSIRQLLDTVSPLYWPDGTRVIETTVRKILSSSVYRGTYSYSDISVENAHPAIIGPEDAAFIDAMLEVNREANRTRTHSDGCTLAGLVHCPPCARKVYTNKHHGDPAYRCSVNFAGRPKSFHWTVNAEPIDGIVLDNLWRRLDAGLLDAIIGRLEGERVTVTAERDNGDMQRRALDRKIEGLTKSLADPDVSDLARKVLLAQLDQAARDLDALMAQKPATKHLDETLAFYRKLRADKSFMASLPLTWADEDLMWRRRFIRRFVERVDVSMLDSHQEIIIHYKDGEQTIATRPHRWVTGREITEFWEVFNDPARPKKRGMWPWVQARMAERGFYRSLPAWRQMWVRLRTEETSTHAV